MFTIYFACTYVAQRQADEYEALLTQSRRDREACIRENEKLKEQTIQSTQTIYQLRSQLADCKNRIATLEQSVEVAQVQLKEAIEKASRAESEHSATVQSLMTTNHHLKNKLNDTIGEIEKQMQAVRDDSAIKLAAAEKNWKSEQEKARHAQSEVETMKVSQIQNSR